ncbi:MAG: hypothetical protein AB1758_18395 [Candidatus Eremiobacterota bacterium]
MSEVCPDPPREPACRWQTAPPFASACPVVLEDPSREQLEEALVSGLPVTVVLSGPMPAWLPPLLPRLQAMESREPVPGVPWTLRLDIRPGIDDDLARLEEVIAEAAAQGARHVLVGLQEEPEASEEYLHRLFGLIRTMCDEAGLTFAAWVPGARLNRYLASARCCRWGTKGTDHG